MRDAVPLVGAVREVIKPLQAGLGQRAAGKGGGTHAPARSSVSARPMIWEHRTMRCRLLRRAMSSTRGQYSPARALISSELLRNWTRVMSMPTARQTSVM